MADATTAQKQDSPKENTKTAGRIALKKIWLHDGITLELPGNSIVGRIDCEAQTAKGRPYIVAHFVPAHQVIELEWYRNESSEPHRRRLTMSIVKWFD